MQVNENFNWTPVFGRSFCFWMQRYKLYVESMPVEDIPTLTDEQIKRIKDIVYNSKAMRERNEDVSMLLAEANMDYAHMMNKLVFDESLKRQSSPTQEFTVDLVEPLPVDNSRPPAPRYIPCNLNVICLKSIKILDACGQFA